MNHVTCSNDAKEILTIMHSLKFEAKCFHFSRAEKHHNSSFHTFLASEEFYINPSQPSLTNIFLLKNDEN